MIICPVPCLKDCLQTAWLILAKAAAINGAQGDQINGQGLRRLQARRFPNGPQIKEILSPVFAEGVRQVILTLGNKGALAITPKGILKSLTLKVKGPLSHGDTFFGRAELGPGPGQRGMSCALQWASASATANLQSRERCS